MVDKIYAKYQVITGNYIYGDFKYDCIINNKYTSDDINESYFNKFNTLLKESLNKDEKYNIKENDLCAESFLNEDKVCAFDKKNDLVYGNLNFGVLNTIGGEITNEEISNIHEIIESYEPKDIEQILEEVFEESNNKIYSDRELICDFIMRIEGYAVRLKEMHWDADKKAQHEITEKTYDSLYELEDSIAEDMMGYMGSYITPGTITPVLPDVESLEGLLLIIKDDAVEFYKRIENNTNCIGIKSEVESFIHEMNKIIYLAKMI